MGGKEMKQFKQSGDLQSTFDKRNKEGLASF